MTALSINLNKIALVRNSRVTTVPNIVSHAEMCISAGADGITVHPRPDQRHIRAQDCFDLQSALDVELNIEGNPFTEPRASDQPHVGDYPGFIALVQAISPAQVTLVPDSDQQLTSDHGFDVARDGKRLEPLIKIFKDLGCRVSLFMDPDPSAMATVASLGADRIELYTESYARAHEVGDFEVSLAAFQETAEAAFAARLGVNAGHDLNLSNLPDFKVPHLEEVSIGHSFTVDALRWGIANTIPRYQQALGKNC
ncbi:pyridoxal phosphate biosynthetic protein [marine gamma proteobacterium HTCC2080]|nr:pyridoxal phosphate biosynthetic protein [marine gamma proteobacterium HTCC2080]